MAEHGTQKDQERAEQAERDWKLAFQLGKEQGLREAQALAVAFLRSQATKRTAVGDNLGAYILNQATDKLSEMRFLTIPESTVMTPDRPMGKEGEFVSGYASRILQQYIAETRGNKPPADAVDQYQIELLRYWMSHLEHVLMKQIPNDRHQVELILEEFLYGAMPHPHDATERERLIKIAHDAISTTTRPRFTP